MSVVMSKKRKREEFQAQQAATETKAETKIEVKPEANVEEKIETGTKTDGKTTAEVKTTSEVTATTDNKEKKDDSKRMDILDKKLQAQLKKIKPQMDKLGDKPWLDIPMLSPNEYLRDLHPEDLLFKLITDYHNLKKTDKKNLHKRIVLLEKIYTRTQEMTEQLLNSNKSTLRLEIRSLNVYSYGKLQYLLYLATRELNNSWSRKFMLGGRSETGHILKPVHYWLIKRDLNIILGSDVPDDFKNIAYLLDPCLRFDVRDKKLFEDCFLPVCDALARYRHSLSKEINFSWGGFYVWFTKFINGKTEIPLLLKKQYLETLRVMAFIILYQNWLTEMETTNDKNFPSFYMWLEDKDHETSFMAPNQINLAMSLLDLRKCIVKQNQITSLLSIDPLNFSGIMVMDAQGDIFVSEYASIGYVKFHSQIHANNEPVLFAGNIVVTNGKITYIDNISGHYKPNAVHFKQFVEIMRNKGCIHELCEFSIHNVLVRVNDKGQSSGASAPLIFKYTGGINFNKVIDQIIKNQTSGLLKQVFEQNAQKIRSYGLPEKDNISDQIKVIDAMLMMKRYVIKKRRSSSASSIALPASTASTQNASGANPNKNSPARSNT